MLIRTVRGVGYLFRAELLENQRDPLMKIRVRSIFTKIVVWAVATVVISLVGFVVTSAFRLGPDFRAKLQLRRG